MRNDLTDISFILDRSGSMASVRDDTIGGFNTFMKGQRELLGRCLASLYQFDDVYETVYALRPIREAPDLTTATFVPRGSTALLDAIGRTIHNTGSRLAAMAEAERPGKVIIAILTDGLENASKEFTRERVFDLIRVQRDVYSWEFVFLGANQDAIAEASRIGIGAADTLTYAATVRGTAHAFNSLNDKIGRMRSGAVDTAFTAEDRKKQEEEGA